MSNQKIASADRTYPPVLVAVVIAVLALLGVASLGSYRDLQAAIERRELLETKIDSTIQRNEALVRRIQRLQDDPLAIERLAREQYRMMDPGDVVIILPEEQATGTVRATDLPPESASPSRPGTG